MSKTKQPKTEPLKTFGVRADEEKMAEAAKLGVNVSDVFRKALDQELMKRNGKCPTCGKACRP